MREAPRTPVWSLSVVSHGHVDGLRHLLSDLRHHLPLERFEVFVTLNLDEPEEQVRRLERLWPGELTVIRNSRRKGFAANHNAALCRARGRFIAAIDPELRLHGNPFDRLAAVLEEPSTGIATTLVCDADGQLADNAREVISPRALLARRLHGHRPLYSSSLDHPLAVDWVAGLFMSMRRDAFARLGGFDERYFLYCEDADLCLRAWNEGLGVYVVPAPMVTHVARRRTLKHLQHFAWHCASLAKLWRSSAYRRFMAQRAHAGRDAP